LALLNTLHRFRALDMVIIFFVGIQNVSVTADGNAPGAYKDTFACSNAVQTTIPTFTLQV
jgi:hypothetical protein